MSEPGNRDAAWTEERREPATRATREGRVQSGFPAEREALSETTEGALPVESTLDWLALARGTLDRAGERRRDDAWVAERWADPRSRVLVIERGRALVHADPALVLLAPDQAPDGERYLLGVDPDGVAYFAVSAPLPAIEGTKPAGLRETGAALGDRDAGLLTQAVALQNWHATHTHCPRCGAPTRPASAGHTRICTAPGLGARRFRRGGRVARAGSDP